LEKLRGLARHRLADGGVARLKKVPLVAVQIFKDGDSAVGFLAGGFEEFDAAGLHKAIVTPEIVGVKEQEDTATCLIAYQLELFWRVGPGEKQACPARRRRSNDDPTLPEGQGRILHNAKAERLGEKGEGFVVLADEQSDVNKQLRHDNSLSHDRT
jgi:hypothetical protein